MKRKKDLGYCLVANDDGSAWHLQRDQYLPVRAAWDKGALRVDTIDFDGAVGEISLRRIDSVWDVPPEAVQNAVDAARADAEDDTLNTR